MICISCKTEYNANFCPNCGEKAEIKKITSQSIIEDAFSTLTNMDKGFLYNLKTLFIDPKKITTTYILGKRKGILNPISYLILLVTLYLIIENLIRVPVEKTATKTIPEYEYIKKVAYTAGKYLRHYFKYFWIFSVVPLATSTRLIFRKYNFMEHLAICSFILGQATLVGILSYIVARIEMVINPFVYLTIMWLMYRIFKLKGNEISTFLESITVMIFFIIQLILSIAIIGFVMA